MGLYCIESPDVWFFDIMTIETGGQAVVRRALGPMFLRVCEPDSFVVLSATPDVPAPIGASIEGNEVRLQTTTTGVSRVTVLIAGKRSGYADVRFARYTKEQMQANQEFWAQQHGG